MPLFIRSSFISFLLIFANQGAHGQSVYSFQRPQGSLIDPALQGEVAFFYETTHPVKDQRGAWSFDLGKRERASINILNEYGRYQETVLFHDGDEVFAFLQFRYNDEQRLMQIEEKNQLFNRIFVLNYQYDTRGRPQTINCTLDGVSITDAVFTAKGEKQLSENLVFAHNKSQLLTEYRAGRAQQRQAYDSTGTLLYQQLSTYNANELIQKITLEMAAPDKANIMVNFTYLYDDQGNWIKMLEHNRATGIFTLVQREIVYQDQLPKNTPLYTPVGLWSSSINNLVLQVKEDGSFNIIDKQKREVLRGLWSSLGGERYQLRVRNEDQFGGRRPFRSNQGLIAELHPGRLVLYDEDGEHHFEFLAEAIRPTPELLQLAQEYTRWEASLWEGPGKRSATAVPADIQDAFDQAYPVAPNRYRVYLDSLCGIIDGTGQVLIPFAYQYINLVSPDTYVINTKNKAGLIDAAGEEILPPIYDRIWLESKIGTNIFGTRKGGERYYYLLDKGTFFPYEKEDLMSFNDNRWVVRKGRSWLLCDREFHPLTQEGEYQMIKTLRHDRYLAAGKDQYWIIDAAGNEIASLPGYRDIRPTIFGYLQGQSAENRHYNLIDYDGQVITEPRYESLTFCRNAKEQRDLYWELRTHNALAKYRKPNGEVGSLTGLGQEVPN